MKAGGLPGVLITGARALETIPERAAVVFRGGRVSSIESQTSRVLPPLASAARGEGLPGIDGEGMWLLPGWIDLQANDISWLAGGLRSPEEHRDRIVEVLRLQAARGTTGLLLATLAAPEEEVLAYLRGVALVRAGGSAPAAALLGALVEGTFMNPALSGAHNPAHVRRPDPGLIDRLLSTGGVRAMNLAPEMAEDPAGTIRALVRKGVLVGCGHAKPSGALVREAAAAGLSYAIHLGNGPTGSSLKGFNEGGLLEEALRNDAITATLILDGFHIDRRLVRDIIARKEVARVVGVSDAGFADGAPPGEFTAFGIRGRLAPGGGYLAVVPPSGAPTPDPRSSDASALFGSAVGMREVFQNALNWLSREMEGTWHRRHEALPFTEALRAAAAISSANPARLLGESGRGSLAAGSRADAVLARVEGEAGEYRVEVEMAWVGGEPFFPPR